MGISKDNIDLMDMALSAIGKDSFNGLQICELGNQRMRFGQYETGKEYLSAHGAIHISIDRNGMDGAIVLDLAKPIKLWRGKFDLVTNYGTSEHVQNQKACFDNINNFCKAGGAMVHAVPFKGTYKTHCNFHYDTEFFVELAKERGYTIVLNEVRKRTNKKALVCVVMVKGAHETIY